MKARGRVVLPGDKSISHRALILGAISEGRSEVTGILTSADVRSTASVLRSLGVAIGDLDAPVVSVEGTGRRGMRAPSVDLDAGNSGTTTRLMAGVLAAQRFRARIVGDASLSRRPMGRISKPLTAMGAGFAFPHGDGLPMTIGGGDLRGLTWHPEVASAQVKSAILLAGYCGDVPTEVHEPSATRDHTERMMRARGADVRVEGTSVSFLPGRTMTSTRSAVPGDPSSAAFFAGLAALAESGEVELPGVCVNPGRVGAFGVLERMGARVRYDGLREDGGEPVATLYAAPSALRGVTIEPDEVPSLIDELPLLACVAARAEGETRVTGAAELRVKESDRIALVVANLRSVGAEADELPDGFIVRGSGRPLAGPVVTRGDHRIAMAFGVLGAATGGRIAIDDPDCAGVSYPSFWAELAKVTH